MNKDDMNRELLWVGLSQDCLSQVSWLSQGCVRAVLVILRLAFGWLNREV